MNDVVIKLTQREAEYVKAMLATDSLKIQAVYKKREVLKGLFRENSLLNGNVSRKITNALKVSGKYEVEDEPLYYVRLPLAYWDEDKAELEDIYRYLRLNVTSEETEISGRTTVSEWQKADGWKTKFTEKEIKALDERYWQFRVPVSELEGE
ncbi:TPA: DUF1642 domain-containing protein [Listeria monocytogenes]|nr:DUF1642 domain-containing protein [Listeria monocytogenes]HBL8358542.1 DUF1642 domain-containing protein [Listeria monocytogenes]